MSERLRVLVTDAESTKALAVVRALGADYDVWTTSPGRAALASWSRFTARHVPIATTPAANFADAILTLCRREGITVVITPEESSSYLLARAHERFSAAEVRLATAPLAALEAAMDKGKTVDAARATGVAVPRTMALTDRSRAAAAARTIGYPVVVKPRYSHFWTGDDFLSTDGVRYASSDSDLESALEDHDARMPLPLLQEFVPGKGRGVFLLIGAQGKVLAEFAHERIRDLRPTGSGSVMRRSVAVDPTLRDAAVRLLRQIAWRGAAMVEFRGDERDGVPKLMEINGRLWGSLQLATDAGVNFPRLLVEDALGLANTHDANGVGYRTDVVLRWWLGDLVRLARVFRGRPRGFVGAFPSRFTALREFVGPQPAGTRHEILRWSDPLPAIGEIVSALTKRSGGE